MKAKRIISLAAIMVLMTTSIASADQVLTTKKNYNQNNMVTDPVTGEVAYESLTVEEATQKAIANSHTLKNLSEQKEEASNSYDNNLTSFTTYIDEATSDSNQQLMLSLKQLTNSLRSIDANEEIAKESIELNIQQLFNSIKTAEANLDLYDENMVIQEKNIKVAEVKKSLGLISQLEYYSLVKTYDQTVSEKNDLEISLDSAYRSLNEAMGTDLNKKYTLVYDEIVFEPMSDTNVQTKVNQALSSAESVKSAKESVELAEFDYKTYIPTSTPGLYTSKVNAISEASRNLEDTKTNLEQSIRNLYENIITAESTYNDTVQSLNLLKSQCDVIKTQYEAGQATEIDYLTALYNVHSAEVSLDSLVMNHDIMVKQYANPDLIG